MTTMKLPPGVKMSPVAIPSGSDNLPKLYTGPTGGYFFHFGGPYWAWCRDTMMFTSPTMVLEATVPWRLLVEAGRIHEQSDMSALAMESAIAVCAARGPSEQRAIDLDEEVDHCYREWMAAAVDARWAPVAPRHD